HLLRAKHFAFVIDHGEDGRALAEIIAERHSFSGFVAELKIQGYLCVELLGDGYFLQQLGCFIANWARLLFAPGSNLREGWRAAAESQREKCEGQSLFPNCCQLIHSACFSFLFPIE